MSQPPQDMSPQDAPQETAPDFEEFYVEPPRMGRGDIAGVIGALLALLIIGVAGYVWLNPELDFGDLRAKFSRSGGVQPPAVAHQHRASSGGGVPPQSDGRQTGAPAEMGEMSGMGATGSGDTPPASTDAAPAERPRCASCGMFTDQTLGLVQAVWSDSSHTSHDCWSCTRDYSREHGLQLASATVLDYSAGLEVRQELDAQSAWFLYDTDTRIEGSMPPFTAAFADKASAEAAQASLGGEVADFDALMERLHSADGG